jgi:hypothetical protein
MRRYLQEQLLVDLSLKGDLLHQALERTDAGLVDARRRCWRCLPVPRSRRPAKR